MRPRVFFLAGLVMYVESLIAARRGSRCQRSAAIKSWYAAMLLLSGASANARHRGFAKDRSNFAERPMTMLLFYIAERLAFLVASFSIVWIPMQLV